MNKLANIHRYIICPKMIGMRACICVPAYMYVFVMAQLRQPDRKDTQEEWGESDVATKDVELTLGY